MTIRVLFIRQGGKWRRDCSGNYSLKEVKEHVKHIHDHNKDYEAGPVEHFVIARVEAQALIKTDLVWKKK